MEDTQKLIEEREKLFKKRSKYTEKIRLITKNIQDLTFEINKQVKIGDYIHFGGDDIQQMFMRVSEIEPGYGSYYYGVKGDTIILDDKYPSIHKNYIWYFDIKTLMGIEFITEKDFEKAFNKLRAHYF